MARKLTAAKVEEMLNSAGVHPDKVIARKGVFSARFGFFYTNGRTTEGYAAKVADALPQAAIIDYSKVRNTWPKDSYFEVKFAIEG